MTRRARVPGSAGRPSRRALRGMDGGPQLTAALDALRRQQGFADLVVVDNGRRGPNILDTRGLDGDWVIEGVLPAGVIAALCDLDDPSPQTLLENGFDVVIFMETRGAVAIGARVRHRVYFHPRLGLKPPEPFWAAFNGRGWEACEEPPA